MKRQSDHQLFLYGRTCCFIASARSYCMLLTQVSELVSSRSFPHAAACEISLPSCPCYGVRPCAFRPLLPCPRFSYSALYYWVLDCYDRVGLFQIVRKTRRKYFLNSSASSLQALSLNRWERSHPRVFIRGFLRLKLKYSKSYGEFLSQFSKLLACLFVCCDPN
jgi:hypothetical protein